ncbi:PepSY-like domain-containing protein [Planctomyces sp. SH-PL62]|uniref:PepSY-like domain-containing protein n=1 Tax=Planctomyces sp. SH-PL62 TaxID=1636152 RepID=UPI00078E48E1|nr:PepSY-like domain-containing protein [Planctomyces sp. SH-PL62]AMV39731.1 hypothetical protein VT85_20025 [Planctomyces sp. SH-PL62]
MRMLLLKSLGVMILAAAASSISVASADDAPKAVVDAVKAKFPKAEIKHVDKEEEDGEVVYELRLQNGADRVEVEVREDGRILQIETEVKPADLPRPVADLVAAKHPGKPVKKAEKVVKFEKGAEVVTYEVVVEADGKKIEIEATPAGKLVDADGDDEHEEKDED